MRRSGHVTSNVGACARARRWRPRDGARRMASHIVPHADREGCGMRAGGRLRCDRVRACFASSTVAPS